AVRRVMELPRTVRPSQEKVPAGWGTSFRHVAPGFAELELARAKLLEYVAVRPTTGATTRVPTGPRPDEAAARARRGSPQTLPVSVARAQCRGMPGSPAKPEGRPAVSRRRPN